MEDISNDVIEIVNILECSICLENLNIDTDYIKTICAHEFHTSCLLQVKNNKCPLCRTILNAPDPIVERKNGYINVSRNREGYIQYGPTYVTSNATSINFILVSEGSMTFQYTW